MNWRTTNKRRNRAIKEMKKLSKVLSPFHMNLIKLWNEMKLKPTPLQLILRDH